MTTRVVLKYEKHDQPINGELGTIRTMPENYYVASVYDDQITFEGIEPMTKDIDQDYVAEWAKRHVFKQNWQCSWCGLLLSEEQYLYARFDHCPKCGRALYLWHRR